MGVCPFFTMKIELENNEYLLAMLEASKEPALLLDYSLKVIAANIEATVRLSEIAVGSDASKYLSAVAAANIANMAEGEICSAELFAKGLRATATVLCARNAKLMILDSIGYAEEQRHEAAQSEPENKENSIGSIAARLRAEHFTPRKLPFFDTYTVTNSLIAEIAERFPDIAKRIVFESQESKLFGIGSQRDFALISAVLLALCAENSENGYIFISSESDPEHLFYRFFCSDADLYELPEIRRLRLLAEGNLWSLTRVVNDCGRSGYEIRVPQVAIGEEFLVRDISAEFLREAVALAFSELLSE